MITLKKSLTQCTLDSWYTFMAENSLSRFDCLIDIGYLDEPLRKILEKHPMYRGDGTILLNLSVNACKHINYRGDAFTGEIGLQGRPTSLYIPYHAFVSLQIPLSETATVEASFPIYDRLVFDAQNPTFVHPYAEAGQQSLLTIAPEAVVKWMHNEGHTECNVHNVGEFIKYVWPNGVPMEVQEYLVEETANMLRDHQMAVLQKQSAQAPVPSNDDRIPFEEAEIKPLLEFPDLSANKVVLQQPVASKFKGKPTLTLIKGGKK
ncbi:hypothetical protein AVT69_gp268 [Pseudomonas phage PhiPA3]|uniref:Uncharacterized protein 270 n=1 Tax=Pseudomonas phage PhiPA3 TaxID=998086 RepID=F8SJA7_BPPA3|nr:hypothetical protein AVT69_gp268 [Pseudomonas phage PhiPA3]AEH03693.1 hypothetical protein [Pseudomonas phage PhiPA3]